MIKEIEKPEINFNFYVYDKLKFYYDEDNREYFSETEYGSKFYFNLNGQIHRIGKPAIEYYNGDKIWRKNGKMHRLNGPAYISRSYKDYWINSKHYTEKKFAKETNHLICRICGRFCRQRCFI